ncbi:Pex19 protein family-domain-containing protein [Microdochium bolleyi]|uniref:Pex19 protein family-domain-containing protein n=1 Tax=Microdochium bolleyi TaxID=196109 RepID=A0A136IRY5_9PEZI|nr:Pex19 protein family-domain-containing protein [Microdochium bolleyi]
MDTSAAAPTGDAQKPTVDATPNDVTTQQSKTQSASAAAAPAADDEDVPDPDEDDLDDLDDMLDEFSSVKVGGSQKQAASGPGRPAVEPATAAAPSAPSLSAEAPLPGGAEDLSEAEFQRQLQEGMAELMSDLENSPDMQKQFESIFKGLNATVEQDVPAGSAEAASAAANDAAGEASFQETIRRTMERMQTSGDEATAAASKGGAEDDFIAEMMKAMKDLPAGGGEGGEEDFTKMLMGMMEQLTNKDILYEPMKELHDKFPDWLEKNRDKTPKEDLERYEQQQVLVKEMVAKFEEPKYADSNAADREYIVERMQKMQAAGSPPPDLVGDMPSAKEVLDGPDESCAPQ